MDILGTVPMGVGGVRRWNYSSGARLRLRWRMETCPCWVAKNAGKVGLRGKQLALREGWRKKKQEARRNSAGRPADECFRDHDVQGCTFPDSG